MTVTVGFGVFFCLFLCLFVCLFSSTFEFSYGYGTVIQILVSDFSFDMFLRQEEFLPVT